MKKIQLLELGASYIRGFAVYYIYVYMYMICVCVCVFVSQLSCSISDMMDGAVSYQLEQPFLLNCQRQQE